MNLLSYDEILRTILIGLVAAPNILIVYFLFTNNYKQQAKFLEDQIKIWTSMKGE